MKYQRRLKTISKINTPQVNIFALGTDDSSSNFGKNEVTLNNGYPTDSISKEWYGDTSVENPDTYPGYQRPANTGNTGNTGNNNVGNSTQKDNSGLAGGLMAASGSLNQLIGNMLNQASIKDPEAMKDNYRAQLGGLDTSSFDALNASKKAKIANVSASDFTNMTKGAGVLNGISAGDVGATAGNAIVPGWGALVGGVLGTGTSIIGTIRGRRKARRAVKPMNDFIKEVNTLNNMNFVNQNNNLLANQVSSLEANYKAEGGFLNMGNNIYESDGNMMYYAPSLNYQEWLTSPNVYPESQNKVPYEVIPLPKTEWENAYSDTVIPAAYSYGGQMGKHSNDFSNGLVSINNGGSHEMNPNQGVQIGVDNQGTPNLVEEGETVFGDFVFSNRITVPKEVLSSFGIKTKKKMTYADVSKHLAKESEERPNDQISQRGLERNLGLLSDAQEKQKMQKDAEERMLQALNAVNPNMPADPTMAMQGEEQLQEEQMQEEQMAQEQAMQEQAMQEQAMQEQMMQEQMAQQGGQPMMGAYGGFLSNIENKYANGGILSYDDGEEANLYPDGTSDLDRNAYYDFMRKVGMSKKNRKYFESLEDKLLREKLMAWVAGQQQNNNPYGASILDWTKKYFPSWYDEDTKASETADIAQTAAQDNASGELLPSKPQWDISNLNTAIPQATATNSYAYTPFTMDQMQGDVYASKYKSVEELENSTEFKTWTNELITNPSAHYDWIEVILSKIPDGLALHKELKPDGVHWATDAVLSKRISELRNDHKLGPFHFSGSTLVYDPKINTLPMQKVLNPYDRYFMKTEDGSYKLVNAKDPVLYLKNLNKGYMKVDERTRLVTKEDDGGTDYYYDPNSTKPMKMTPGEFLRFMPAVASGAAFVTDGLGITNVPNYEFVDPLVDMAVQRSAPAYWNPIGDYLPYKPVDKNFAINQMNAEANANRRALMDVHAGNRGSASGALIMANNNYLNNIGDFTVTADEQNWTKLKDKSEFNKDTNYKNADGFMRALQSNQSQFNQDFSNYMSALKLKQDIYNNSENIKATNAQNFFNTLGEIGKEIQDKNMAKRTANAGTYGPGAEQFLQGFFKYTKSWDENGNRKDNSKAYGGKFKRRR